MLTCLEDRTELQLTGFKALCALIDSPKRVGIIFHINSQEAGLRFCNRRQSFT